MYPLFPHLGTESETVGEGTFEWNLDKYISIYVNYIRIGELLEDSVDVHFQRYVTFDLSVTYCPMSSIRHEGGEEMILP